MWYEDIFGLFGGTFDMRGSEDILICMVVPLLYEAVLRISGH